MKQEVMGIFAIYASEIFSLIIGKIASYYGQRILL
jgi:hypothetical protein